MDFGVDQAPSKIEEKAGEEDDGILGKDDAKAKRGGQDVVNLEKGAGTEQSEDRFNQS